MKWRAVDVIETIINSGIKYDETVDICQAIKKMRLESEWIVEKRGTLKNVQENVRNFYILNNGKEES